MSTGACSDEEWKKRMKEMSAAFLFSISNFSSFSAISSVITREFYCAHVCAHGALHIYISHECLQSYTETSHLASSFCRLEK